MSKYNVSSALQKELQKINRQIDLKIITGQPYRREARRHKTLLSQISHLTGKSFSFFSFF